MAKVIEHVAGRYDVCEVELGKVYRWRPGRVVVDCDCGERATFTEGTVSAEAPTAACPCGADHAPVVREELDALRPGQEGVYPWRSSGTTEGLPF